MGCWFDSFGQILWKSYPKQLTDIVLLPAFVAEVSFCAWLIWKGGRLERGGPSATVPSGP